MTRRGRQAAEVRRSTAPVTLLSQAGVLYVLSGAGRCRGGELRAREGVWWAAQTVGGEVAPLTADGALLWANITAC